MKRAYSLSFIALFLIMPFVQALSIEEIRDVVHQENAGMQDALNQKIESSSVTIPDAMVKEITKEIHITLAEERLKFAVTAFVAVLLALIFYKVITLMNRKKEKEVFDYGSAK